jgi:hypothetical protein
MAIRGSEGGLEYLKDDERSAAYQLAFQASLPYEIP